MTCTPISSPTRRAAAAPRIGRGPFTDPTSPRMSAVNQPRIDFLPAHQTTLAS